MFKDNFTDELRKLIGNFLQESGYELIELFCRRQGRDLFLCVLSDRPQGGITMEECSSLNKGIGAVLEEKKILDSGYILEVSSPGLTRPLKTKKDFLRCIGKEVRLFLSQSIEGRIEAECCIKGVAAENLIVDQEGRSKEIPLSIINMAKQIIGE